VNAFPEQLGPYRLEGRLGRGGMGEVFRAFDLRLERPVAVKLIRRDTVEDPRARERFRREARAAASLNHPAIVQIHDIVETPEGDAIVMELVAGQTLASLLKGGPLGLERALGLGSEIALGLAAAHARGVVHRDLKPENVMVTDAGHAKILDFGLAKRSDPGEPEAGETSLSVAGTLLGTYRSMSPEQARGLPVDARSDLFSLGSLLYEALTGRSPFAGETLLETLTRICTARQPPAAALRPEVPEVLSDLVDRLLAKDPADRPESAEAVAAALDDLAGPVSRSSPWRFRAAVPLAGEEPTLVDGEPLALPPRVSAVPRLWRWGLAALLVAALALAAWAGLRQRSRQRLYVAVPKPRVTAPWASAGEGAEQLAIDGLSPLSAEQVDSVTGPPAAVARALAADEVVTAQLDCNPEVCQVALSRIGGKPGSLLWTETFQAPTADPFLLAEAVEVHLKHAYPDHGAREGVSPLAVGAADYREYLLLRRAFESESAPPGALLDRLAALRARAPRFLEAAILEAEVLRLRFSSGRDPADPARALSVLAEARRLGPSDPRPLVGLFDLALKAERLERAEAALHELERLEPGDANVLVLSARLAERRGGKQQALALMREAVRRRPSWIYLARLADMEYRLGESDAARRDLHQLLARSPGQYAGQSLLAQIELLSGSPERAAVLYSDLVQRSPHVPELVNLGLAYLLLKRYPEAEARFRQAVALQPDNPFVNLNLADVEALRGNRQGAEARYRRVLDLAERDPAAAHWQLVSVRAQALAHLGERSRAVEAAQQVLFLAHDNAQAAQEVSLVDVLVGDEAAALANAGRALAAGVEPVWFGLPWYDPLRASPELQALLKRRARPAAP
jgi:serine/threonine-protein kinase